MKLTRMWCFRGTQGGWGAWLWNGRPVSLYDTNVSVSWDFNGDGVSDSSEITPSYVYGAAGVYSVTVNVTLADGHHGQATAMVTAGNTQANITLTHSGGDYIVYGSDLLLEVSAIDGICTHTCDDDACTMLISNA